MRPTPRLFPFPVRRLLAGLALVPLLVLAACGGGTNALDNGSGDTASGGASTGTGGTGGSGGTSGGSGGGGSVTIAGQGFTEMKIMLAMYSALLGNAGYDTTVKTVDTRDLYGKALISGKVDVAADYASSMTEYLNKLINGPDAKPAASPDISTTIDELTRLGKQKGLEPLKPAAAEDANAFAVTKKFAKANDVHSLSDLGDLARPIKLAAAPDCKKRSDCKLGLQKVYGIDISRVEPLGFASTQTKKALQSGEVQLGQVGTSEGSLDRLGLVVLTDDKDLQNAENLVPVVNSAFLAKNPKVAPALNKLAGVLTTKDLQRLNAQVDVQRKLPEDVAKTYLTDNGLL